MKEIAPDLYLLRGFPPVAFNVYVIRAGSGWILVDTSTRHSRRRILRQFPGKLDAILITHAHADHAGTMHAIATETGAPVWTGERDADAVEGKAPVPLPEQYKDHIVNRLCSPDRGRIRIPLSDACGRARRWARGSALSIFPDTHPGRSVYGANRTGLLSAPM